MDRQTPDALTEDERTNQISTASAVIGTPSEGDDVIDGGFLLEPLNGLGGIDLLIVDYSGSSPDGRLPEGGVAFEILSGPGPEAVIDYGDGTRDEIEVIANFERLDATGSAFDDSLSGGSLNDALRGGAGNDRLNGGPGNDIISGGAGDDFIRTLNAGDQIDGGADRDTLDRLILSETSKPIALAFGSGTNLELSDGTRLSNVEVYNVIELGTGDDNVDAGFLNQGDSLSGGDGTDLLIVDYSGSSPDGRLPEGGVAFEILSGPGPEAVIDYGDATRKRVVTPAGMTPYE